jgi:hypothetical protein
MNVYIVYVVLAFSTPMHPNDKPEQLIPFFFQSVDACRANANELYVKQPTQGRYSFSCVAVAKGKDLK